MNVTKNNFVEIKDNRKEYISKSIKSILNQNADKDIIFLCVGSNNINGDMIGPLVGNDLLKRGNGFPVYGNMIKAITPKNINDIKEEINNKYKNPYIIVICSCFSSDEKRYLNIVLKEDSTNVGGFFCNEKATSIGDFSILSLMITGKNSNKNLINKLINMPLEIVNYMANIISDGIIKGITE